MSIPLKHQLKLINKILVIQKNRIIILYYFRARNKSIKNKTNRIDKIRKCVNTK